MVAANGDERSFSLCLRHHSPRYYDFRRGLSETLTTKTHCIVISLDYWSLAKAWHPLTEPRPFFSGAENESGFTIWLATSSNLKSQCSKGWQYSQDGKHTCRSTSSISHGVTPGWNERSFHHQWSRCHFPTQPDFSCQTPPELVQYIKSSDHLLLAQNSPFHTILRFPVLIILLNHLQKIPWNLNGFSPTEPTDFPCWSFSKP